MDGAVAADDGRDVVTKQMPKKVINDDYVSVQPAGAEFHDISSIPSGAQSSEDHKNLDYSSPSSIADPQMQVHEEEMDSDDYQEPSSRSAKLDRLQREAQAKAKMVARSTTPTPRKAK